MARNIFSRQIRKLQQRGFDLATAKRIAYRQQVKNWHLIPWTYQLTDEWKDYSNLFSEKRAVIRRNNAIANRRAKRNSVLVWITQP